MATTDTQEANEKGARGKQRGSDKGHGAATTKSTGAEKRAGMGRRSAARASMKRDEVADDGKKAPKSKHEKRAERHEHLSKAGKIVLVAIGCLAMLLSVTAMACSGFLNQESTGYHLTGGVAATVNGTNITEDTVTRQIMSQRSSLGYDSDEDWAQYLVDQGQTPEDLRQSIIDSYEQQLILQKAINENNIEVSDDEVQSAWDDAVANYDSEDAFLNLLSQMGYTEDTYKEQLRSSLEQQKLRETVAAVDDPTDQEIIDYINADLETYNGARKSSHILFQVDSDGSNDADQQAAAQEVLDKINNGEISFEDAAKEYSDDSSADNGGDVGWDCDTTFVTEYEDALKQLDKGQISGVVKSTYGYHIIQCTDVFTIDGSVTSIDQVPEDIRTSISDTLKSQAETEAYNTWYDDYAAQQDVQVNDMPADVPYNVSLDGVEPSTSTDASAADSAGDTATDSGSSE